MMKPCQPKVTKAPKKGGKQGTKWKDPCSRRQMNHLRGGNCKGNIKFPNLFLVTISISNKGRGGLVGRRPSQMKA
jgi:hypothetical protein